MSGWRHHAEIRSILGMEKFATEVLWHTLNFEAQQSKVFHHLRHASRNQAEVFTTNEHVRDAFQRGKFLHRLFQPEIVLSAEKIIDVEIPESLLHIARKIFE